MRALMKTELKKALHSPRFLAAVLIGLALAAWCLSDAARSVYGRGGWFEYRERCMETGAVPADPESTTLYTIF